MLILTFFAKQALAQSNFPTFLEGTWKMENRDVYEKWELLEDGSLSGISYRLTDGEQAITEYLEIRKKGEQITYTATVPTQNEGKGIEFVLHKPDSLTYSFENPEHDFPQKIIYQKVSDTEIHVSVRGDDDQGFSFTMKKEIAEKSNILISFFADFTGTWMASPDDSSFVSRLEYTISFGQFFVPVRNTLTSKTGEIFAEYEGVYIYNPVEDTISFTTVSKNEVHTGISWVKGDTLFHKANISGPGNIKSYTSAIVKMPDSTLYYYADYSQTEEYPELQFNQALVYRKEWTDD